jgi:hypothetical protein
VCKLEQENMQKFRLHARAQVGVANQNERHGRDCGLSEAPRTCRHVRFVYKVIAVYCWVMAILSSGHMNPLLGKTATAALTSRAMESNPAEHRDPPMCARHNLFATHSSCFGTPSEHRFGCSIMRGRT